MGSDISTTVSVLLLKNAVRYCSIYDPFVGEMSKFAMEIDYRYD